MFQTLKKNLNILEAFSKYVNQEFKQVGDNTYCLEDDSCPYCNHNDCFRIKDLGEESFGKCFSCDINGEGAGDIIHLVAQLKGISLKDAALLLYADFGIPFPSSYSPIQQVFDRAAEYYHTALMESQKRSVAVLGGISPLQYQLQVRKHSEEVLTELKVGWSDGRLVDFLLGTGIEESLVRESGLMGKKGGDFLPKNCFIYPHFIDGKASHFTFKDPTKRLEYQIPNKFKLNSHMYYNQDSLKGSEEVLIVEGENDLLSVLDADWSGGVLACIGSLSGSQVQWAIENLQEKNVVTVFDSDDAGDKYRAKFEKVRNQFKSLRQVRLEGVKDIDDFLKSGKTLEEALEQVLEGEEDDDEGASVEVNPAKSKLVEKDGAYFKVRYKDGQPFLVKISNFTIKLRYIFIQGGSRKREIVIRREDGRTSEPVIIDSEVKVSMKPFKALVANAIDASYYGKEEDLIDLWEHVYMQSDEKIVHIPSVVGRLKDYNGWVFRDGFIGSTGGVIYPDDEGVMWIAGKTTGVKPVSIDSESNSKRGDSVDIPSLVTELTKEETEDLLREFLRQLSANLACPGKALTMLGWAMSNVYSDVVFSKYRHFPFLYIWGRNGGGKTNIAKWVLGLFGMSEAGYTTIPNLKSGVGFSRKVAYYASLPVCVDEIRADNGTADFYGVFRSWYNRVGRTMGVKDSFGIRTQDVRSNFVFSGQDVFTDTATRERCVHVKISPSGREMVHSYRWIESNLIDLSSIGYNWILESYEEDTKELLTEIEKLDRELVAAGCTSRTAKNWSIVGVFANKLAKKYAPEFDYIQYMKDTAVDDTQEQQNEDMVMQFFNIVEGLQVGENPKLTRDHVAKEGDKIYIWFAEVFRILQNDRSKIEFSKHALLDSIKEEDYFVEETRYKMGLSGVRRRVVILDFNKAPEVLKSIGEMNDISG